MASSSRTRYVLLGLLVIRPRTGYELQKAIEKTVGHFWSEGYGRIYPELTKMQKEELLSCQESTESGRLKKMYSITDKGEERLKMWLARSAVQQVPRNEFLLKIFLGKQTGTETLLRHLERYLEEQKIRLEKLSLVLKTTEEESNAYLKADFGFWRMTIKYSFLETKSHIKWAESCLGEIVAI